MLEGLLAFLWLALQLVWTDVRLSVIHVVYTLAHVFARELASPRAHNDRLTVFQFLSCRDPVAATLHLYLDPVVLVAIGHNLPSQTQRVRLYVPLLDHFSLTEKNVADAH